MICLRIIRLEGIMILLPIQLSNFKVKNYLLNYRFSTWVIRLVLLNNGVVLQIKLIFRLFVNKLLYILFTYIIIFMNLACCCASQHYLCYVFRPWLSILSYRYSVISILWSLLFQLCLFVQCFKLPMLFIVKATK